MTTLLIIACVIAFLVWLGRLMRRREQAKFRDVDAQMLGELRQEHKLEPELPTAPIAVSAPKSAVSDASEDGQASLAIEALVTPTRKHSVLTDVQRATLHKLEGILAPAYRVFPNVAIADFVTTSTDARVSFLLCDQEHLTPALVVEFVEKRNEATSAILAEAGIPVLMMDRDESEVHLRTRLIELEPGWVKVESANHRCPKCYGDMQLRAPKTGKHAGKRYWLCKTYPRCRGAVSA